ncbi:MAG: hypothetical protein ACXACG_12175 [Candidatus Thorarchaeota archaeon]|jgi:hypothetical protein
MLSNEEKNYTIVMNEDNTVTIQFRISNSDDAIEAGKRAQLLLDNFTIGRIIGQLRQLCTDIDGVSIVPKTSGLPDDLRLAISLAVAYPDGLSRDDIQEKLEISDNSRKAYINSPQKRTSTYLKYDRSTKTATITEEGISWIQTELDQRESNQE